MDVPWLDRTLFRPTRRRSSYLRVVYRHRICVVVSGNENIHSSYSVRNYVGVSMYVMYYKHVYIRVMLYINDYDIVLTTSLVGTIPDYTTSDGTSHSVSFLRP